jgi:hypothetical protein
MKKELFIGGLLHEKGLSSIYQNYSDILVSVQLYSRLKAFVEDKAGRLAND